MQQHMLHAALALTAIGPTAFGDGPVPVDNFDDGDDIGWTHVDYTEETVYGPGLYTLVGGSYRLHTHFAVPANEFNVVSAKWDASSDRAYTDGFVRAKIRSNASNSNPGITLRATIEPLSSYACGLRVDTNEIFIQRVDCWPITECGDIQFVTGLVSEVIDIGEDWMLEAGAVGDTISLKAWPVGGREPVEPQLVWTESTYSQGSFGVAVAHQAGTAAPIDATFDDVVFIPPPLFGDLNGDYSVNAADLAILLASWNTQFACFDCAADLDEDSFVDAADLALLLASWS
jgi:hypothetical protein